jgi:hypothetical protein
VFTVTLPLPSVTGPPTCGFGSGLGQVWASVFRAAGLPAPYCSFTHVTVNGADLGVYANVETVDEEMIARIYGDHDGELFEGTLSDFQSGWTGTFDEEFKNSDQGDLDPGRQEARTGAQRDSAHGNSPQTPTGLNERLRR